MLIEPYSIGLTNLLWTAIFPVWKLIKQPSNTEFRNKLYFSYQSYGETNLKVLLAKDNTYFQICVLDKDWNLTPKRPFAVTVYIIYNVLPTAP